MGSFLLTTELGLSLCNKACEDLVDFRWKLNQHRCQQSLETPFEMETFPLLSHELHFFIADFKRLPQNGRGCSGNHSIPSSTEL